MNGAEPGLQPGGASADAGRMRRGPARLLRWGTLLLLAAFGAAAAGADEPDGDAESVEERPVWVLQRLPDAATPPPLTLREEVCEARLQLRAAEARRTEAEVAFRRARRDDYPRGVERQLLKEQKIRRGEEASAAATHLAEVEARADDAPLSWQLLEPCPEPAVPASPEPDSPEPDSPDRDDGPSAEPATSE